MSKNCIDDWLYELSFEHLLAPSAAYRLLPNENNVLPISPYELNNDWTQQGPEIV